jgi:hypothetical protein
MEIEDYIILTYRDADVMQWKVNRYIQGWWIPLWGLSLSSYSYAQAMIKYKSKESEQNSVESPSTVSE